MQSSPFSDFDGSSIRLLSEIQGAKSDIVLILRTRLMKIMLVFLSVHFLGNVQKLKGVLRIIFRFYKDSCP